jgi:two-component system cell cycle response regulator
MATKILTVDDSKTIRLIVAKAFKPFDCQIVEAASGVEGLEVAAREKPDIILLDVTMPVMDGFEMLTKLKADDALKGIPVIMLTAEAGRDNVLRIAKLGVRDYLIKPFKEELIIERVGRVVTLNPRDGAGAAKGGSTPKILVVDDKPAIIEQVRTKLGAETKWTVDGCGTSAQAVEYCRQNRPGAVLVSLSLPEQGAFTLFQTLRANPNAKDVPMFAVSLKTAVEDQNRALQAGFTANITKPIDFDQLKARLATLFKVDVTTSYAEQRDGVLVIAVPAGFNATLATEITVAARPKIAQAVDEGIDTAIVDLTQVPRVDVTLLQLCVSIAQACQELSLRYTFACTEAASKEFREFEEAKDWTFAGSYEDAVAHCKQGATVA